jgi:hypothetical protein
MIRWHWLVGLVVSLAWGTPAAVRAEAERFALVIGNNLGAGNEQRLRYAESDAERVYAALRDVGGVSPVNMTLLRGEDADTARGALIMLNDRLRDVSSRTKQTTLIVYYSGHADAQAMHLGDTRLAFDELARLVRGSSAALRLLVVDACRSGTLTHVKGGRPVPAFALPAEDPHGEGFALLTASTAAEDAQESDELGASFFTHAFVSGLRGAADEDGDRRVMLDEAYRHAYAATLRASSQSVYGTQHPTFQYEVRGREAVVLARLDGLRADQARVELPLGTAFLLLRGSADGQVIAEVPERSPARLVVLPSGRYFVRGRGRDHLLEGTFFVAAGSTFHVQTDGLTRVEYAQLVRKGGAGDQLAHGPFVLASVRSAIRGAERPCLGGGFGYALHFRHHLSVLPRAELCESGYQNDALVASTREYGLGVATMLTADVARMFVSLGFAVSLQLSQQRFETPGVAPSRLSLAPYFALVGMVGVDLGRGFQLAGDARLESYLLHVDTGNDHQRGWDSDFAVRGSLSIGKLF